jgi:hypothetical protein
MQVRFVEPYKPVVADDVLQKNYATLDPGVFKGGRLSLIETGVKITPMLSMTTLGSIIEETKSTVITLANDGWKTIFLAKSPISPTAMAYFCADGVKTEAEIEDSGKERVCVLAWVYKDGTNYELVRPNDDLYHIYKMHSGDFVDCLLDPATLMRHAFDGTEVTAMGISDGVLFFEPASAFDEPIEFMLPFSVEEGGLGSIVITRKITGVEEFDAQTRFTFASCDGKPGVGDSGLTGKFETTYPDFEGNVLTTKSTSPDADAWSTIILRPTQTLLSQQTEEQLHPALPTHGVIKMEVLPTEYAFVGAQYIQGVGFSKSNIPQQN